MWQKKLLGYSFRILLLLGFIYLIGCDIYKSEETQISGIDKTVCEQFSDSVFVNIESVPLSQYFPDVHNAQLSTVLGGFVDSLLTDSLFVEQNTELAYELTLGAGNDTTYLAVKSASGTLTLFATGIVNVNLYQKDGKRIEVSDDKMPLATISGCTELSQGGVMDPIIKLRLAYKVGTNSDLLLQLIKVEQTKARIFKLSLR